MIYLQLFWEYFKIGLFTIGGGYAMLPLVSQVVTKYGWLSEQQLANFVAVAESTPGPFAINLATFVGTTIGNQQSGFWLGLLGATTATVGVVLPSVVIIIVITKLLDKFRSSKVVDGLLYGMKPVVVGLLGSALLSLLCKEVLPNLSTKTYTYNFDGFNPISLALVVLFAVLSRVKIKGRKIHPILLILFSALVGVVLFGLTDMQS